MSAPLPVVLRCSERVLPRARYVLETLMCAGGIPITYASRPPSDGPWMLYGESTSDLAALERCVALPYVPSSWDLFTGADDVAAREVWEDVSIVLPASPAGKQRWAVPFDLLANAFYFLSSWSERVSGSRAVARGLYAESVFRRLQIEQDVVDRYLEILRTCIHNVCDRLGIERWAPPPWPDNAAFAVVLSHDVDFLPNGRASIALQGAKSVLRHLIRQRDVGDAARAATGVVKALLTGRDPYGCLPEIIAGEKERGVRASFQVAVARRHPNDVNYRTEDPRVRSYLKVILEHGFELCLHGSYRSTEKPDWYIEEVGLLEGQFARPLGSRQHFLAFNYDALFSAQEQAGIRYDMSMGYPDRVGSRSGFSYPYFPYCLREDRPYRVLQICLFLMDVTLRSYMGLKGPAAWDVITSQLRALRRKGGCASVVWHPIVFGGARDPGYDQLFWKMVDEIGASGGVATDGRTIYDHWQARAGKYPTLTEGLTK